MSTTGYHRCGPRKPHWWSTIHVGDTYTCSCGRSWEFREGVDMTPVTQGEWDKWDSCRGLHGPCACLENLANYRVGDKRPLEWRDWVEITPEAAS